MTLKKNHIQTKLLILGSGPAGYTAAIYGARAGLNPKLVTGISSGGQLMTTTHIENWPAEINCISGPDLMDRFRKHAQRLDVDVIQDHIEQADLSQRPFKLTSESGRQYICHSLIIAMGASAKYLGLPSEEKYWGKGVSSCATCDGFFFRNQSVAVVGGGNTAAEEALYLTNIASSVTLIHRREKLRAETMLTNNLLAKIPSKLQILYSYTLEDIQGNGNSVDTIVVRNLKTGETNKLPMDGVFIAIGHTPNTKIFQGFLEMNNGYIAVKGGAIGNVTATNIPGVFAAGDVQDQIYRQAITSAASGCMAALDAQKFLDETSNV